MPHPATGRVIYDSKPVAPAGIVRADPNIESPNRGRSSSLSTLLIEEELGRSRKGSSEGRTFCCEGMEGRALDKGILRRQDQGDRPIVVGDGDALTRLDRSELFGNGGLESGH